MNHAGEYGAIRIYEAQLRIARRRAPELLDFLEHTLGDERRHRDIFEGLMLKRRIRPCRTLSFWGLGGSLLGSVTGLLGRSAILGCTEAVERTVHRHLEDQLRWLGQRDPAVSEAIRAIQVEELEHLRFAESGGDHPQRHWLRALDALIAGATEALIWLSTYGASSRLARQIAPQPQR